MKDLLGKFLMNWRIRTVLPHIEGRLLDIGCGTNDLVRLYEGEGTGVDVYQWGNVDLIVENTASLPFKNGTFDTITIVAALNHIPNRNEVLSECYRILKATGKIIITMIPPNISRIWHFLRKPWDADQKERGVKDGEVPGFSSKVVRHFLLQADFHIIFRKKFMFNLNSLTIAKK